MESSNPEKPRSRRDKKSRSGCQTCKLKRMKCDETRPECRNCVRRGRACPGYQVALQWSMKHEQAKDAPAVARTTGPLDFEQLVSMVSQAIAHEPTAGGDVITSPYASTASVAAQDSSPSPVLQFASAEEPTAFIGLVGEPAFDVADPLGLVLDHSQPYDLGACDLTAAVSGGFPLSCNSGLNPSIQQTEFSEFTFSVNNAWYDLDGFISSGPSMAHGGGGSALLPMSLNGPIDTPTSLVEHWFKSVCCYWSALDSDANPYRILASSLWGSSKMVFYSLQSMAAASLIRYLPHLEALKMSSTSMALEAISEDLAVLYRQPDTVTKFPSGLVLSLFCIGSSLCWTDPQSLGTQYVRQVSKVLRLLKKKFDVEGSEDRDLWEFFNGCLKYEVMLRNVTGDAEAEPQARTKPHGKGVSLVSARPHAWTGVSPEILDLFGRAVCLCRKECVRRRRKDSMTMLSLQEALKNIECATELEETLLGIDYATHIDSLAQNGDLSRSSHLHDTTEAYRLSSLLQLYLTFPDLIARRIPGQVGLDGVVPHSAWLSPLALHIMTVLERIPTTSDLRCIQPLLYLSTGSCLRYDNPSAPMPEGLPSAAPEFLGLSRAQTPDPAMASSYSGQGNAQNSLDICKARALVLERLDKLEEVLPPKPIAVAKQLVKAVWAVSDQESPGTQSTHWLDVMASTGLKTVFG
ncbi:fungal-specific transcription factor domain-containing protein [Xylariales sp. PMI_506]|nr:fungal-specific transcription factor domain-containing protein [Xylariales sp. PMI_506]